MAIANRRSIYNLVLIGETGSGKTSFLNLICNFAAIQETGKKIDEKGLTNIKEFHDITLENPKSKKMESKTSGAKLYNIILVDLEVGVIDTPGFNDSRGFDQDKINTEAIIKTLKESKHINCVCLVVNGRSPRIGPSLKYVLAAITSILPKTTVNNVIVMLTNSADEDDATFDVAVLQQFFGKQILDENIFYIDNPCCKLGKAQEKAKEQSKPFSSAKAKNIAASFQITAGVLKEMYETIKEFQPVYTTEFIEVYEKKEQVEVKVLDILTKYDEQNDLQKCIRNEEIKIEAALRHKKLNEDYSSTKTIEYHEVVPLEGRHNTLCGNKGCYSNCHIPCYLDMSYSNEVLKNCARMNGSDYCTQCGCYYTYHRHEKAKFVKKKETKSFIDSEMKYKFLEAKSMQERADALKTGYQKQLHASEEEKRRLSEELVEVINEFEDFSMSRNFATVLESQLELIDRHIKGEDDTNNKSNLKETKDKLSKKLDIVKEALPKRYA